MLSCPVRWTIRVSGEGLRGNEEDGEVSRVGLVPEHVEMRQHPLLRLPGVPELLDLSRCISVQSFL